MTLASIKSLGNLFLGKNKYDGKNNWTKDMGLFHKFSMKNIDGKDVNFGEAFAGKVLLVTNVACKCGYTQASYDQMQKYSIEYGTDDFAVVCFPCNQFMGQEPWEDSAVKKWVLERWPKMNAWMMTKIEVNGNHTHEVYQYLKACLPGDITWNFSTKFVIGKDGIPIQRFDVNDGWTKVEECLREALNAEYAQESANSNTNGSEVNPKMKSAANDANSAL